jgi:HAD superfamily hydrolase (TIGR01509 family)
MIAVVKKFVLFDNDGVLVDTEHWYYTAGERALAEVGVTLDKEQYLLDMARGAGAWAQARAAGLDDETIDRLRLVRNGYYQEYLRTEPIEIDGVVDALEALAPYVRMAIVTTSKREDFELIHRALTITAHMDVVLVRGDYARAKPDPDPYLTALRWFGAQRHEALVVEDSSRGLASAVAAGIDCAVVDNAFTASQDFSQATWRIRSLAELTGIVLGST